MRQSIPPARIRPRDVSYLFVPYSVPGHVHPTIAVVGELVRRGNRVRVLVGGDFVNAVARTGAEAVALQSVPEVFVPEWRGGRLVLRYLAGRLRRVVVNRRAARELAALMSAELLPGGGVGFRRYPVDGADRDRAARSRPARAVASQRHRSPVRRAAPDPEPGVGVSDARGMNSVQESIVAGVPMAFGPRSAEQRYLAGTLVSHGVGELVDVRRWTPQRLFAAVSRLADDPVVRENLVRLRASFSVPGERVAADLLTAWSRGASSDDEPAAGSMRGSPTGTWS